MLGRIWVFITPWTIALRLRGFDIYQRRGVFYIPGEKWLFFSYFEEKYMKSLRATPLVFRGVKAVKGQKSVKKSSKEATKLAFSGIFGGVFSRGDLGQYFFLVL